MFKQSFFGVVLMLAFSIASGAVMKAIELKSEGSEDNHSQSTIESVDLKLVEKKCGFDNENLDASIGSTITSSGGEYKVNLYLETCGDEEKLFAKIRPVGKQFICSHYIFQEDMVEKVEFYDSSGDVFCSNTSEEGTYEVKPEEVNVNFQKPFVLTVLGQDAFWVDFSSRNGEESGFKEKIQSGMSGNWWNSTRNGEGLFFDINIRLQKAIVYWYTYDEFGNQRWMFGATNWEEETSELLFEIHQTTGPFFGGNYNEDDLITIESGELKVVFNNCSKGAIQYTDGSNIFASKIESLTVSNGEACSESYSPYQFLDQNLIGIWTVNECDNCSIDSINIGESNIVDSNNVEYEVNNMNSSLVSATSYEDKTLGDCREITKQAISLARQENGELVGLLYRYYNPSCSYLNVNTYRVSLTKN